MNAKTPERVTNAQLQLAAQTQLSLLPKRQCCLADWETAFSYEPAGYVSGDYIDLIERGTNAFFFVLGDISGKGIAASMLMSHLHATMRILLRTISSLEEVVRETSRSFCQTSLPAQFATLILGQASSSGEIILINAGHTPAILVHQSSLETLPSTGVPLGLFCEGDFKATQVTLTFGETLFLYSDGISETEDDRGNEYGSERLKQVLLSQEADSGAYGIIASMQADLLTFSPAPSPNDDRTMLAMTFQGRRRT